MTTIYRLQGLLEVFEHFLELQRPGRPQQFVDYHLGRGNDGPGGPHALQPNFPVPFGARTDCVRSDVDEITIPQGAKRGLHYADMTLHPA